LRKYFGHEVNSYNDFIYSFSPFIDYDFLKDFSLTKYFGSRFNFHSDSIKLKKQSTLLYYKIVNNKFPSLTYYNSTRGFSMHDAITLPGNLKIVLHKYFKNKNRKIDGFNTSDSDRVFLQSLSSTTHNNNIISYKDVRAGLHNIDAIYSLCYWLNFISNKYT